MRQRQKRLRQVASSHIGQYPGGITAHLASAETMGTTGFSASCNILDSSLKTAWSLHFGPNQLAFCLFPNQIHLFMKALHRIYKKQPDWIKPCLQWCICIYQVSMQCLSQNRSHPCTKPETAKRRQNHFDPWCKSWNFHVLWILYLSTYLSIYIYSLDVYHIISQHRSCPDWSMVIPFLPLRLSFKRPEGQRPAAHPWNSAPVAPPRFLTYGSFLRGTPMAGWFIMEKNHENGW